MRIVSWNIQWARGIDGRVCPERIATYLRALDADIICLQEVADGMADLPGADARDQFAVFAGLLAHYHLVEGASVETFTDAGGRRRFGNAILSRLPVLFVRRHALPWCADGAQSMPRLLLEIVVHTPSGALRIMTTHLEYFSRSARAAQLRSVRKIIEEACARAVLPPLVSTGPYAMVPQTDASVLAGDFNMPPSDPLWDEFSMAGANALRDAWRLVHDRPHPPSFCIADATYGDPHCSDFVLVSESLAPRVQAVYYDVETRLSDHQPVFVDIAGGLGTGSSVVRETEP